MTPAGIEPATFRFVAQHLNHCATVAPSFVESGVVCFGRVHITAVNIQVACCSETSVSFYKNKQC